MHFREANSSLGFGPNVHDIVVARFPIVQPSRTKWQFERNL